MTTILIVGHDVALLEGLSQTLVAAGHHVFVARDIPEAFDSLRGALPLVAIVERGELMRAGIGFRVALARGGAVIAFHHDDSDDERLPFELKRATLAELQLPLERQRLLALVKSVESRARAAGKDSTEEDSEDSEISRS